MTEADIKALKEKLNPRQQLFCELFTTNIEYLGNGTQAYIKAYDIDVEEKGAYASARQCAYKLLTNIDIMAYINALLEDGGLNDANIDKQLLFVANQNADFGAKMQAIKEYNALKQRIKTKLELDGGRQVTIVIGKEDATNDEPSTDNNTDTKPEASI